MRSHLGFGKRLTLACLLYCFVCGCVTSAPPENLSFAEIEQLHEVEGVYSNRGEPPPLYLSEVIWPGGLDAPDRQVRHIEVRAVDANTLQVSAIGHDNSIIQRDLFVEGKEFELDHGVIRLKARPIGGVSADALGIGYEEIALGIDEAGHGKYRLKGMAAGAAFLVLPVVAGVSEEVRFQRLGD